MRESYTLHELARDWKKHYVSLLRMIYANKLNAFKVGVTWRVKAEERERIEKQFAEHSNK